MNTVTISNSYLNTLIFTGDIFQIEDNMTFEQFKAMADDYVILVDSELNPVMFLNIHDDVAEHLSRYAEEGRDLSVVAINAAAIDEDSFNACYRNVD